MKNQNTYPMFLNSILMTNFAFHHLLKYPILLVDIPSMYEVAPCDEYDHQKHNDRHQHDHEGHAVLWAFIWAAASTLLVAAIIAVVYPSRLITMGGYYSTMKVISDHPLFQKVDLLARIFLSLFELYSIFRKA